MKCINKLISSVRHGVREEHCENLDFIVDDPFIQCFRAKITKEEVEMCAQ